MWQHIPKSHQVDYNKPENVQRLVDAATEVPRLWFNRHAIKKKYYEEFMHPHVGGISEEATKRSEYMFEQDFTNALRALDVALGIERF